MATPDTDIIPIGNTGLKIKALPTFSTQVCSAGPVD